MIDLANDGFTKDQVLDALRVLPLVRLGILVHPNYILSSVLTRKYASANPPASRHEASRD
jgi:hypothetical protein